MNIVAKIIAFLLIITLQISFTALPGEIKNYEFAGSFYPRDKDILNSLIDDFLNKAEVPSLKGVIYGIVSPHAGYIYSASVAAYSYKVLKNNQRRNALLPEGKGETFILLGPSHRYYFEGVSIYPQGSFQTPLGGLEVDAELAQRFKSLKFVKFEEKYFYGEHSLEVQLPFIIKTAGKVKIVPILFGQMQYSDLKRLAEKLSKIRQERNIVVIVSTDLSHYHPYDKAKEIDKGTASLIKEKNAYGLWVSSQLGELRACGIYPLITFLLYTQMNKAEIEILKYANSADTAGGKDKVVGYLSVVAYRKGPPAPDPRPPIKEKRRQKRDGNRQNSKEDKMGEYKLTEEEKTDLLKIARITLESYLKEGRMPELTVDSSNLTAKRGAFVTLKKKGQLRGCIGRIAADTALYKVVSNVAIDSALHDPRFPPVEYEELKDIEIEISVLTPIEKVDNLEDIKVGRDGLIIRKGFYSGLLLPQVPLEYGWDRETFLKHTSLKAGLPPTAYKDKDAAIYRFRAIVFSESDLGAD